MRKLSTLYLLSLTTTVASICACLPSYDPPPELAQSNAAQGLYNPDDGPLSLTLTEPIVLKTLEVNLYLSRTNADLNLCIADANGALPQGCTETATKIIGPCLANPSNAIVDSASPGTLMFECDGGLLSVGSDKTQLTLAPQLRFIPYEQYRIVVSSGLEDTAGRSRKVPIEITFQVESNIDCAPTDFRSGFFFAVFKIEQPTEGEFHFLFWIQGDADTGQFRLYGSRLRAKDGIDPTMSRDFTDWDIDHNPDTGSTIIANGQTATTAGQAVFVTYPFVLNINQPRIKASSVELTGQIERGLIDGAPANEREIISGRLSSALVLLGEGENQADLGSGQGTAVMFRLLDGEAPDLAGGLPKSVSLADVQAPFDPCD